MPTIILIIIGQSPKRNQFTNGKYYGQNKKINHITCQGSFFPRLPDGKRKKFNMYAKTREECEAKLAEMIAEKKAEIAEMKKKAKNA